jgi:hypothetical protein
MKQFLRHFAVYFPPGARSKRDQVLWSFGRVLSATRHALIALASFTPDEPATHLINTNRKHRTRSNMKNTIVVSLIGLALAVSNSAKAGDNNKKTGQRGSTSGSVGSATDRNPRSNNTSGSNKVTPPGGDFSTTAPSPAPSPNK